MDNNYSAYIQIAYYFLVESTIDLVSKPDNGSTLYNNQPVSVLCTARHSQVLVWESNEYIGQGRQVAVFLSDSTGVRVLLSTDLEVLVISTSNTLGDEMIQSRLTVINVTSTYPNFTITCRNSDHGMAASVSYHTTGKSISCIE